MWLRQLLATVCLALRFSQEHWQSGTSDGLPQLKYEHLLRMDFPNHLQNGPDAASVAKEWPWLSFIISRLVGAEVFMSTVVAKFGKEGRRELAKGEESAAMDHLFGPVDNATRRSHVGSCRQISMSTAGGTRAGRASAFRARDGGVSVPDCRSVEWRRGLLAYIIAQQGTCRPTKKKQHLQLCGYQRIFYTNTATYYLCHWKCFTIFLLLLQVRRGHGPNHGTMGKAGPAFTVPSRPIPVQVVSYLGSWGQSMRIDHATGLTEPC